MASSNKTDKLQLPQWQLNEKPEMEDFNGAFDKIEDFKDEFDSHKAESVQQTGGVHGLTIETLAASALLVNGWTSYITPLTFTRINNRVLVNGGITGGVITKGTTIFVIPDSDFMPPTTVFAAVTQYRNPGIIRYVRINANGTVMVDNNYDWVSGSYYFNFTYSV